MKEFERCFMFFSLLSFISKRCILNKGVCCMLCAYCLDVWNISKT